MKKLTLLTMIVAVCAFVVTSCGGGGKGATPADLAKKMNGYIKAGEYEKAMRFWAEHVKTNDKFDAKTAEEQKKELEEFVTLFSAKLKSEVIKHDGIKSVEITNEEIDEQNNKAAVSVLTTYGDGENDTTDYNFIREDGTWKFNDKMK